MVLEAISDLFPESDIYALFGNKNNLSKSIKKHNIYYSFLNRIPLVGKMYRYTFHLWPVAIESLNLSKYDLVISNSASVAHGAIASLGSKHIAYINSPMRYAWDLSHIYTDVVKFGSLKNVLKNIFVSFNRVWDVVSSRRADIVICNSNFVKDRIEKYWGRKVDAVVYPPSKVYTGKVVEKRSDYYVSGAPFEPNKRGDFLLECASKIGFRLKLIGDGSMRASLEKKYRGYRNIEFLGWVSDSEKWNILSHSKGFIIPGIEDYGIFCVEAISCGTPVLAFKGGGSLETIEEGCSGEFFSSWNIIEFGKSFKKFDNMDWDNENVRNSLKNYNTVESFQEELLKMVVE